MTNLWFLYPNQIFKIHSTNISIAGLYVCPNSIFWVTGALYCACFTDPGDGGYNDFITGERKKSRNEHRRSKMGEQEKRRQYLIQALLRERSEYEAMEIPMQEDEQRQLLRGLMNIRAPKRCSEEFLRIQDAYLQEAVKEKGIVE